MTPPPISIDGTDITGATIDGQEVQEITVDGQTVFTSALDNYIFDNFNDNSLSRPRTGQEDGNFVTKDGTTLTDARVRPDWTINSTQASATGGVLEIDQGGTTNTPLNMCEIPVSIQPPLSFSYDYDFNGVRDGDGLRVGFSPNSNSVYTGSSEIVMSMRPLDKANLRIFGGNNKLTLPNTTGFIEIDLGLSTQTVDVDGNRELTVNENLGSTSFNFFGVSKFDDDSFQSTNTIDNLKVF